MGTSNWQNISYNIQIVKLLNPMKILDVGIGFGRWGILFREFLEVWGDNNYSGKWKRKIDGIEIFPDYIKPYHEYFYDNIHICNALDFLRNTGEKYDLINFGDVIEHFEKEEGIELIKLSLKKSRYTLINIPVGDYWPQDSINGNEYEKHRSIWKVSDFKIYKNHLIKNFEDIEMRKYSVVLLSEDKINLKEAYGKHFYKKNIIGNKLKLKGVVKLIEKNKRKNNN